LAQEDNRVKTVHKPNTGVGLTRNIGLQLATGEYINFIDSDDWMDSNHLEDLYQVLIKTNSDIAIANFSQYNEEKKNYTIHLRAEDYYEK
ncbi:glycosyltransferase, partial [Streptococcus pneumoniae]|uniref:glycosyltransferase family 2 protein n=2 Tax=Streptococcus TaxID=1301 RepID=UPI001CBDF882